LRQDVETFNIFYSLCSMKQFENLKEALVTI